MAVGGVDAVGAVGDGGASSPAPRSQRLRRPWSDKTDTLPAGRDERHDHVVADGDALDTPHRPRRRRRRLRAPSTGKRNIGMPPVTKVMVGVAHARRFHLDLDSPFFGSPISISSIFQGWLNSRMSAPLSSPASLHSKKPSPGDVRGAGPAGWSIKDKLERVPVLGGHYDLRHPVTTGGYGFLDRRRMPPDRDGSLADRVVAGQLLAGPNCARFARTSPWTAFLFISFRYSFCTWPKS